jgi:hypothetical protein
VGGYVLRDAGFVAVAVACSIIGIWGMRRREGYLARFTLGEVGIWRGGWGALLEGWERERESGQELPVVLEKQDCDWKSADCSFSLSPLSLAHSLLPLSLLRPTPLLPSPPHPLSPNSTAVINYSWISRFVKSHPISSHPPSQLIFILASASFLLASTSPSANQRLALTN